MEINDFLVYTLEGKGSGHVRWLIERPVDYPPNKFEFGHRVVVGRDKSKSAVYAIVEFFSTISFAIKFYDFAVKADSCQVVDIDPFANSPPGDIADVHLHRSFWTNLTEPQSQRSLKSAIEDGTMNSQVDHLLTKIADRERTNTAKDVLKKLGSLVLSPTGNNQPIIDQLLLDLRPQAFRLLRVPILDMSKKEDPLSRCIYATFELLTRSDCNSPTGLTPVADQALNFATTALVQQIVSEYQSGSMDQERLEMLIGGGPGVALVAKPIFDLILDCLNAPR
jgi:hypothetical protein